MELNTPANLRQSPRNQYMLIMKKTLITLLALAGVTLADTVKEYTAIFANSRTDTQTSQRSHIILGDGTEAITLSSWMIEFQIQKQADNGVFFSLSRNYQVSETSKVERGGLGVSTFSTSGMAIAFNNSKVSGTELTDKLEVAAFGSLSADSPVTLRFAFDAESDVAYLYNVGTGKYITATGLTGSYDFVSVSSTVTGMGDIDGKAMFWTDSGASAYKLLGVTDMSAIAGDNASFVSYLQTKTIPEPATATLSLLALAGLTARRRRK